MNAEQLIYIPHQTATRPEDGPALAQRFWVVHRQKGLAFRLTTEADSEMRLVPLCSDHPFGAESLAQKAGHGHEAQQVQAVFLRHADVLLDVARAACTPSPRSTLSEAAPSTPTRLRAPSEKQLDGLRWAKVHALVL